MVCRTSRPKVDLVRIVRTSGGFVGFDPTGRANGRGAYLCRAGSCWAATGSRAALERALAVKLQPEMNAALAQGPDVVFATPDLLGLRADILIAFPPTDTQGGARGQE